MQTITVYAFSVENFKRPADEVDGLMTLAICKFKELTQKLDFIHRHQIRIRVIGELHLLPVEVRAAAEDAMRLTEGYQKHTLNVAFSYTSTAEIVSATDQLIRSGKNPSSSVLDSMMYVNVPVDLFVRTSGEQRVSEFLTWQLTGIKKNGDSFAPIIHFTKKLWPELSFFDFVLILLDYQYHRQ